MSILRGRAGARLLHHLFLKTGSHFPRSCSNAAILMAKRMQRSRIHQRYHRHGAGAAPDFHVFTVSYETFAILLTIWMFAA
jgi:hypothetical protein